MDAVLQPLILSLPPVVLLSCVLMYLLSLWIDQVQFGRKVLDWGSCWVRRSRSCREIVPRDWLLFCGLVGAVPDM
jgi:hypothetical protein